MQKAKKKVNLTLNGKKILGLETLHYNEESKPLQTSSGASAVWKARGYNLAQRFSTCAVCK